jgi:hypothetical protein
VSVRALLAWLASHCKRLPCALESTPWPREGSMDHAYIRIALTDGQAVSEQILITSSHNAGRQRCSATFWRFKDDAHSEQHSWSSVRHGAGGRPRPKCAAIACPIMPRLLILCSWAPLRRGISLRAARVLDLMPDGVPLRGSRRCQSTSSMRPRSEETREFQAGAGARC